METVQEEGSGEWRTQRGGNRSRRGQEDVVGSLTVCRNPQTGLRFPQYSEGGGAKEVYVLGSTVVPADLSLTLV